MSRSTRIGTIAAGSISLVLAVGAAAGAQAPLASIGVGRTRSGDSTTVVLSFSYNRLPGDDPTDGGYLKAWHPSKHVFAGLKPSTEINIGSGAESSPNNVLAELGLDFAYFKPDSGNSVQHMFFLAPSANYTSDKDFTTRLVFGRLEGRLLVYRSVGPDSWRGNVLAGLKFDAGSRQLIGQRHYPFTRWVPSVDGQFRSGRWSMNVGARAFAIHNDTTVVKNGVYGLGSATLQWRKDPKVGYSLGYTSGFDEPLYHRQNVAKAGVAFYR